MLFSRESAFCYGCLRHEPGSGGGQETSSPLTQGEAHEAHSRLSKTVISLPFPDKSSRSSEAVRPNWTHPIPHIPGPRYGLHSDTVTIVSASSRPSQPIRGQPQRLRIGTPKLSSCNDPGLKPPAAVLLCGLRLVVSSPSAEGIYENQKHPPPYLAQALKT